MPEDRNSGRRPEGGRPALDEWAIRAQHLVLQAEGGPASGARSYAESLRSLSAGDLQAEWARENRLASGLGGGAQDALRRAAARARACLGEGLRRGLLKAEDLGCLEGARRRAGLVPRGAAGSGV